MSKVSVWQWPGVRYALIALAILCLFASLRFSYQYFQHRKALIEPMLVSGQSMALSAAADIQQYLHFASKRTEKLADALSMGEVKSGRESQAIVSLLSEHEIFFGSTVAFLPEASPRKGQLYAPYGFKQDEGITLIQIEDAVDYVNDELEWFDKPLTQGNRWSRPYFDFDISDKLMTTYSAVFYTDADKSAMAGVVTLDITVDGIASIVKQLELDTNSFAQVVTSHGDYLYTPATELMMAKVDALSHEAYPGRISRHIRETRPGAMIQRSDQQDNKWLAVAPIDGTPWYIVVHMTESQDKTSTDRARQLLMLVCLSATILGIACAALIVKPSRTRGRRLWGFGLSVCVILIAAIIITWQLALSLRSLQKSEEQRLTDLNTVHSLQYSYAKEADKWNMQRPKVLPTGLQVQSLQFEGYNNMRIAGVIWQKFASEEDVERPMFEGAYQLRMEEIHDQIYDQHYLVIWRFEGVFRTELDYRQYPLVVERFSLQMRAGNIAKQILLMPDLNAYNLTLPEALAGVDEEVKLPGWQLLRSYFSVAKEELDSYFGIVQAIDQIRLPMLHFTVEVQRNFIDAFISKLTPLIIGGVIAFFTLLLSTRDKEQVNYLRTGVGFNLSISATIFFVTAYSHLAVRQQVIADEVFYLEYFYFLMYFNLLVLCVHSLAMSIEDDEHPYFYWLPAIKMSFTPVTLGMVLIITLWTFY